jgi:hypothetical protein
MLSQVDKENILSEFPNIKLSYENIIYNKVSTVDYFVAIPEGKKCFAWFTFVDDKSVCLMMELTDKKQIIDIKIINACFSNELSYGTILYGTLFNIYQTNFFSIEDIFRYKGTEVERINWGEKLIKINNMLDKDLKQVAYNNSFIVFGLPLMCKTNEELNKKIENENIKYKISSIQFKLFNKVNCSLYMNYKNFTETKTYTPPPEKVTNYISITNKEPGTISINKPQDKTYSRKQTKRETVFLVRPDIQDDIYYLFCLNGQLKEEQYSIAHIPDYNTSVMMNNLFRIIKENKNLDALEESDDEEEFEKENIDKFVHLNRSYKMSCQFNYKFKKWTPTKLANQESEIVNISELNA